MSLKMAMEWAMQSMRSPIHFGGVAMKLIKIISIFAIFCVFLFSGKVMAAEADYTVYQVYRPIDLGEGGAQPPKDIFVSIGANQGVHKGSMLDVYRRISSFDNLTQKHMGDHMIPVGKVRVIHVDEKTAIARADRFVSVEQEPALLPQAIMIGDVVRPVQ
jgi:hypothetical protein